MQKKTTPGDGKAMQDARETDRVCGQGENGGCKMEDKNNQEGELDLDQAEEVSGGLWMPKPDRYVC